MHQTLLLIGTEQENGKRKLSWKDLFHFVFEMVCIAAVVWLAISNGQLQKRLEQAEKQGDVAPTAEATTKEKNLPSGLAVNDNITGNAGTQVGNSSQGVFAAITGTPENTASAEPESPEQQPVLNQAEKIEVMLKAYLYGDGELNTEMLSEVTSLQILSDAFISVQCGQVSGTQIGSLFIMDTGFVENNVQYGFGNLQDISFAKHLKNCTKLSIEYNAVEDISPIAELTSLKELSFAYNQVSDISPVSKLIQLENLMLFGNQIEDISAIKDLVRIDYLGLWENQIRDITPISSLVNLEELNLYRNCVTDITAVRKLKYLEKLYVWNNQITDISPVAELVYLKELDARDNNISKVSTLGETDSLRRIDIAGNPLDMEDLKVLKEKLPECSISH